MEHQDDELVKKRDLGEKANICRDSWIRIDPGGEFLRKTVLLYKRNSGRIFQEDKIK